MDYTYSLLPTPATALQNGTSSEAVTSSGSVNHGELTFLQSIGCTGSRSTSSKEIWEALKPLIQRIYIDENKPFTYLQTILTTEHNFCPTYEFSFLYSPRPLLFDNTQKADVKFRKRQYSRKIEKWGFRKNVTRSERRVILQNLNGSEPEGVTRITGRQVTSTKIERWRRQQLTGRGTRRRLLGQRPHRPGTSSLLLMVDYLNASDTVILENAQDRVSEGPTDVHEQKPLETSTLEIKVSASGPEDLDSAINKEAISFFGENAPTPSLDRWPFDWSTVDVPGSPGLSRLFGALDIERSLPVPPLDLHTDEDHQWQYISQGEIFDLFNASNKILVYDIDRSPSGQCSEIYRSPLSTVRSNTKGFQSSFRGWDRSPLNEIYVFPQPPEILLNSIQTTPSTSWAGLVLRRSELRHKLCHLQRPLRADHPCIIRTMDELAWIEQQTCKYEKAEVLFSRVAEARSRTLGPTAPETLYARLRVILVTLKRRWCDTILPSLLSLHSSILDSVDCESNLAIASMIALAGVWKTKGFHEEAEKLYRQVLQIALAKYGPRDCRSWENMRRLAVSLARCGRLNEAEFLLRTVAQLHSQVPYAKTAERWRTVRKLSAVLQKQHHHEEAISAAQTAVNILGQILGAEHPKTMAAQTNLGILFYSQRLYPQSESVLRNTLRQQRVILGKAHRETLWTTEHLAKALMVIQIGEATAYYETAFRGKVNNFGYGHRYTLYCCHGLGKCYENQGRYTDALKLYKEMLEKTKSNQGDNHSKLLEIQTWINQVKVWMYDSTDENENDQIS